MLTEKLTREQTISYLDTNTKGDSSYVWALIGVGITSLGQNFNPQKTTEKWIIHKNATTTTDSYQITAPVSQKCYKGDAVFEFINEIRRKAGVGASCVSHILDIDAWDSTTNVNEVTQEETTVCKATVYECNISITKYNDENAVIEYDIDYNGDPILGTVTFSNEKPTFTPDSE